MCGRFSLRVDIEDLAAAFPNVKLPEEVPPRYNIAPSQEVAVVPNTGDRALEFFKWGLVPFWAKDPKIGNRMINARAETAAEKPAFRAAYRRRRCLILADGFYEWRKEPDQRAKTPMYIHMPNEQPFAFAGLWEVWRVDPDADPLLTCTILTTQPNELLKPIHNRMPVILPPAAYDRWLDPEEQPSGSLDDLLQPFPSEGLVAHPVSRAVNNPAFDAPSCIASVAE